MHSSFLHFKCLPQEGERGSDFHKDYKSGKDEMCKSWRSLPCVVYKQQTTALLGEKALIGRTAEADSELSSCLEVVTGALGLWLSGAPPSLGWTFRWCRGFWEIPAPVSNPTFRFGVPVVSQVELWQNCYFVLLWAPFQEYVDVCAVFVQEKLLTQQEDEMITSVPMSWHLLSGLISETQKDLSLHLTDGRFTQFLLCYF